MSNEVVSFNLIGNDSDDTKEVNVLVIDDNGNWLMWNYYKMGLEGTTGSSGKFSQLEV